MEEKISKVHLSGSSEIDKTKDDREDEKNFVETFPVFAQLNKQYELQNIHLQEITEELQQSRNDFKSLFDNAPFAYVVIDREGLVKSCNVAAQNLVGCNKMGGKEKRYFRDLILPTKQVDFDAFIHDLLVTTKPAKLSIVVVNKSNKSQLEVVIHAALNKPFDVSNILLTIEDVTEKNRAIREFKQNENAISIIGEHITDWLILADLEGYIKYSSPACSMIGYTVAEMLGEQLFKFGHPDDLPKIMENFTRIIRNEKSGYTSFRVMPKTGKNLWVEVNGSVVYNEFNKPEKVVFVVRDIQEYKEIEEALVESESRFRSLFVNKNTPMLLIDLEKLNFVEVNPAAVDLFGYPEEVLMKMNMTDLMLSTPEQIGASIEKVKKQGKVQLEMKLRKAKGEIIDVEVFGEMIGLKHGKVIFAIIHDVSERMQAKRQLQKNAEELHNSNVTKDKLFSVIAHDLRNPIGSIMSLIEIINDQQGDLDKVELGNIFSVMQKTATNTFELLENLLDWSRIQRGILKPKLQITSLAIFIDEVFDKISISASNKNIKLLHDIETEIRVKIDSNILESILRNLLTNAIKFSERNSAVQVHAHLNEQKGLVIEVRDEGIGMDNTMVSQLFKLDAFVGRPGTEGEKSSGLGLIICKDYAAMLKGNIYVKSVPNKGSSFFVELP